MHISHGANYQAHFIQGSPPPAAHVTAEVMISERPAEVADRAVGLPPSALPAVSHVKSILPVAALAAR